MRVTIDIDGNAFKCVRAFFCIEVLLWKSIDKSVFIGKRVAHSCVYTDNGLFCNIVNTEGSGR